MVLANCTGSSGIEVSSGENRVLGEIFNNLFPQLHCIATHITSCHTHGGKRNWQVDFLAWLHRDNHSNSFINLNILHSTASTWPPISRAIATYYCCEVNSHGSVEPKSPTVHTAVQQHLILRQHPLELGPVGTPGFSNGANRLCSQREALAYR